MFYRLQMAINGIQWGWWETHFFTSTITVPNQFDQMLGQIAQLRANMLGAPFAVVYARVSQYSADNTTRTQRGTYGIKLNLTDATGLSGAAEPGTVALLVKGFAANLNIWDQFWLGAPPDGAVDQGGRVVLGNNGLGPNFTKYANFLTGNNQFGINFGWGAVGSPQDYVIQSFTQNAGDGTVNIVTSQNIVGYPASNIVFWPARIRGVNRGRSVLNGYCTVQQVGVKTFQTLEQISFGAISSVGKIKVYPPVRTFTPYNLLIPQPIVGEHRRGRPIGFTRGRAPAKVRA